MITRGLKTSICQAATTAISISLIATTTMRKTTTTISNFHILLATARTYNDSNFLLTMFQHPTVSRDAMHQPQPNNFSSHFTKALPHFVLFYFLLICFDRFHNNHLKLQQQQHNSDTANGRGFRYQCAPQQQQQENDDNNTTTLRLSYKRRRRR